MNTIELTPSEAEQIEWALDPMREYWCMLADDGSVDSEAGDPVLDESVLPKLEGRILTLSPNDHMNDDLKHRITDHLLDITKDELADAKALAYSYSYGPEHSCYATRRECERVLRAIRTISNKLGW